MTIPPIRLENIKQWLGDLFRQSNGHILQIALDG